MSNKGIKRVKSMKSIWCEFDTLKSNNLYTSLVSGTEVKNYLLKDTVNDWLKYNKNNYKYKNMLVNEPYELYNEGNKFEEKIIYELSEKYKITIINTEGRNGYSLENYNKTINAIKNNDPIIYQGIFKNYEYGIGGSPDLIVKGYILNELTDSYIINGSKIGLHTYVNIENLDKYFIIDIKWSDIPLCVNDNYIRNEGLYIAYKGQLAIYNYLLGQIQGFYPNKTYILGKAWHNDYLSGKTPYDLLGIIDYETFDYTYILRTCDAIKWIQYLRNNDCSNWNINGELLKKVSINCKNTYDTPYTLVKSKLAKELGEITQIWNISCNHRDIAHRNNIYNINNPNLNSKLMNITGKRGKIIDGILDINRQNINKYIILSDDSLCDINNNESSDNVNNNRIEEIDNNETFIRNYKDYVCINDAYFVDFETINFADQKDILFMIGVGHYTNNEWIFKQFICEELTNECENKILKDFMDYVDSSKYIFHWSNAEISIYNRVFSRHNNDLNNYVSYMWIDLYKIFIDNGIIIKDAYNFKLKTIGKALFENNLITTKIDENIFNGFDAMMKSIKYYKVKSTYKDIPNNSNNSLISQNEQIINNISKYNQIDCKLLYDIKEFLKSI